MHLDATATALFWSRVDKNGPAIRSELGPCWIWTGGHTGHADRRFRYGRMMVNGRRWKAHRLACALAGAPIPDGLQACHHCDVGLCVRPGHIFPGTFQENMADKIAKARHDAPRGEMVGLAKLTAAQIPEIRARAARGESNASIARALGVGPIAISRVVRRITWTHVP